MDAYTNDMERMFNNTLMYSRTDGKGGLAVANNSSTLIITTYTKSDPKSNEEKELCGKAAQMRIEQFGTKHSYVKI